MHRTDSNRRRRALQTRASPLGHGASIKPPRGIESRYAPGSTSPGALSAELRRRSAGGGSRTLTVRFLRPVRLPVAPHPRVVRRAAAWNARRRRFSLREVPVSRPHRGTSSAPGRDRAQCAVTGARCWALRCAGGESNPSAPPVCHRMRLRQSPPRARRSSDGYRLTPYSTTSVSQLASWIAASSSRRSRAKSSACTRRAPTSTVGSVRISARP
jgi:hypothetical protein